MIDYPFIALLALWVLLSALLPSSHFAFSEALFAPVLNPNFIDSRFSSPGTSFSSFISTSGCNEVWQRQKNTRMRNEIKHCLKSCKSDSSQSMGGDWSFYGPWSAALVVDSQRRDRYLSVPISSVWLKVDLHRWWELQFKKCWDLHLFKTLIIHGSGFAFVVNICRFNIQNVVASN